MPFKSAVAQVALLAVALSGSSAMDSRYGTVAASMSPLPSEEARFFMAPTAVEVQPPIDQGLQPTTGQFPDQQVGQFPRGPDGHMMEPGGQFHGQPPNGQFPGQPPGQFHGQPPGDEFQGQPPEGGFPGGPGGEQDGFFGGQSPEEQEKMDQRREEEEARANKDCIRNAKEGAAQMKRELKRFEQQIARLTRQKITVPTEVTDLLAQLKAHLESAKTIQGCEDLQEFFEPIGEYMQALGEKFELLERCAFLPRMKKEITRMFNFTKRDWSRAQGRSKKVKDVDLSELLNRGGAIYAQLEEMKNRGLAIIDTNTRQCDPEQLEDLFEMGEQAQDLEQELREIIETIMSVVDAPRQFTILKRERKNYDRQIRGLKRDKVDTATLEACLVQFDQTIARVQTALGIKPLDRDELTDAFAAAWDQNHDCREVAEDLEGKEAFDVPELFGELKGLPSFVPQPSAPPSSQ